MNQDELLIVFNKINLFDNKKQNSRKCFLFFFFVAILGYAAIITSFCPYNDDYYRYFSNEPVGVVSGGRHLALLIESLLYFSKTITDVAPFTHIISCAILSYIAVIFIKIFNMNVHDKYSLLCLTPIVINPYLIENMIYRFDNPFMIFAMLLATIAAYLSTMNKFRFLLTQSILLIQSMLLYQAALSAYFIVCAYLFLLNYCKEKNIISVILKMRYWFYTILISGILYYPFTSCIEYCVLNNSNIIIIPSNINNIKLIFCNIYRYLENLQNDWLHSSMGIVFSILIMIFCLSFAIEYLKRKNIRYIHQLLIVSILLFIFFVSPQGICTFLYVLSFEKNPSIPPRTLYCFGIFISIVLYKNYSIVKNIKILRYIYIVFLLLFSMWNCMFMNFAGNIIQQHRIVQQQALYDLGKDMSEISKRNSAITHVCIRGDVHSHVLSGFAAQYPIISRILPEKWKTPIYCAVGLANNEFAQIMLKDIEASSMPLKNKYASKKMIKSHIWYDVHLLDC